MLIWFQMASFFQSWNEITLFKITILLTNKLTWTFVPNVNWGRFAYMDKTLTFCWFVSEQIMNHVMVSAAFLTFFVAVTVSESTADAAVQPSRTEENSLQVGFFLLLEILWCLDRISRGNRFSDSISWMNISSPFIFVGCIIMKHNFVNGMEFLWNFQNCVCSVLLEQFSNSLDKHKGGKIKLFIWTTSREVFMGEVFQFLEREIFYFRQLVLLGDIYFWRWRLKKWRKIKN